MDPRFVFLLLALALGPAAATSEPADSLAGSGRAPLPAAAAETADSLARVRTAATAQPVADTLGAALRVYLDCEGCDMPYFQSEVPFVRFVRDPAVAEVHLLVTEQRTASRGSEYTLTFLGRRRLAGLTDTLRLVSRPAETERQIEARGAQLMRLGFVRYLARLPARDRIRVLSTAAEPASPGDGPHARDPWNGWVFSTALEGNLNGQTGTRAFRANGSLAASRVSASHKWTFEVQGNYRENRYDVGGFRYFDVSRSRSALARYVFPLGDHWSGALRSRATSSTFENLRLRIGCSPAIEYNYFPYSESTRRQLRFEYALRFARVDYIQATVFDKSIETTAQQQLEITLQSKEPWGTNEFNLELSNYFHDVSFHRVTFRGETSLRIVEGLALTLGGNVSRIRDQLSLPAKGATPEEILLQRRQLLTDFSYEANLGVRYTFGSIFNPAVNARFGDD